jgi:hypothetical protein
VYTLKIAVVDDAGRAASVARLFAATLSQFGPIRVSDLLVASGGPASAGAPAATLIAAADVRGAELRTGVQLVADTPAALNNVSVTMEVSESVTSAVLHSAPARLADGGLHRAAEAVIPLAPFPPGDYVARAVISVGGHPVGRVMRPFRIAPPPPQQH